jgi:hypothetical protein
VERLFDVGTGDDREIHGRQSAPGPPPRKPACLFLIVDTFARKS